MQQFFLIPLLLLYAVSRGQNDTLNKFNSKGKKQGYWLFYFDNKFKPTDSINGEFIVFDFYDNGKSLTFIPKFGKIRFDYALDSLNTDQKTLGKFKVLNGKINFFEKEKEISFEQSFQQGIPLIFKKYLTYNKYCKNKPVEILDFTKKYNNQQGTFFYELRSCYSETNYKYYFRKGKKKWKAFRIEEK